MRNFVTPELADNIEVVSDDDVDHPAIQLAEGGHYAIVAASVEWKRNILKVWLQSFLSWIWVTIVAVFARRDAVQKEENTGQGRTDG